MPDRDLGQTGMHAHFHMLIQKLDESWDARKYPVFDRIVPVPSLIFIESEWNNVGQARGNHPAKQAGQVELFFDKKDAEILKRLVFLLLQGA